MKYKMTPKIVQQILKNHEVYWHDERPDLFRYKQAYETKFWDRASEGQMATYVQTSDAYGYIESYIASLFARNPGVVVKNGIRGRGDARIAQHLANDFLAYQREQIENASRMALIYPMSFIKMMPTGNKDILRKVDTCAVAPWEIILDRDARRYDDMKFIGHHYYMTLIEARHKFGDKKYNTVRKEEYFEKYDMQTDEYGGTGGQIGDQNFDHYKYIEIVELYDLHTGIMYFWSPDWKQGEKFLMEEEIPFRDVNNDPVPPIVPLYFNRLPDKPVDGYSAMRRIYDQIFETNMVRTYQANAVRKASRQYLVKKGALDEEQMAQITSGIDGLFVEVDEESLAGVMTAVPQNPTPPELEFYVNQVQRDKDKGSILAPFTRGESSRTSATEAAALAAYTSSEIGRLARERDNMIEELAEVYLNMVALYIEEENQSQIILLDGKATAVRADNLEENFHIFAQDQASTPLSESVKKREFIQSIPTLANLGVPQKTLLAELVRALNLPEDFVTAAEEQNRQVSAAKANLAAEGVAPDAAEQAGGLVSTPQGPANLQGILPGATGVS
tara:strand:- start:11432 stop:13111 length:1680 start_codon:yes stop_codon:yes gene_type:complete